MTRPLYDHHVEMILRRLPFEDRSPELLAWLKARNGVTCDAILHDRRARTIRFLHRVCTAMLRRLARRADALAVEARDRAAARFDRTHPIPLEMPTDATP